MEWFALPAVCGFLFEAGGIQFPASPFSGWYSLPEVATRDLLDKQRYNFQDKIAAALGFDIETKSTLWQDRVNTELNIAVLQSYMKAGVAIVDHHTQVNIMLVLIKE
jgi:nitric oxide synthase oxygenase domain/subunit